MSLITVLMPGGGSGFLGTTLPLKVAAAHRLALAARPALELALALAQQPATPAPAPRPCRPSLPRVLPGRIIPPDAAYAGNANVRTLR